ncbi:MAG TPA: N4-gp56 family major capsid protein [Clostridia bacterium]|nr:N4-gp56 family major capsid protein [Clostridia bacterium]
MSNINTSANTASKTYLNKDYYDRAILEGARTRLVHAKYGQKRSIPLNNGKRVEFRRWNLFDIGSDLCKLEEGVTPAGQSLSQSAVEAEVEQYGAYVELSDLLEDTAYDLVASDSAELLGEQLGTVIEWVTRDALCSGNNVQRAGGKASRGLIAAADTLTTTEIRKAVRTLKKAKARPFPGEGNRRPHFICICSPDATYDLQNDALWQDVSKYSGSEAIYSGEIGRIFGVVFVESTESKIVRQAVHTQVASHTAGSANVVVDEITDAADAFLTLSGAKVTIGSSEYTVASVNQATKTITLSAAVGSAIAADTVVYSTEAGALAADKSAADVHFSLVFGKDAYGVVDLEGRGAMQSIVKPRGSAGADDPLDQRSTVGAKVPAYAAKILNDLWLVRIEHGASA